MHSPWHKALRGPLDVIRRWVSRTALYEGPRDDGGVSGKKPTRLRSTQVGVASLERVVAYWALGKLFTTTEQERVHDTGYCRAD
jgi:hypothetical protein